MKIHARVIAAAALLFPVVAAAETSRSVSDQGTLACADMTYKVREIAVTTCEGDVCTTDTDFTLLAMMPGVRTELTTADPSKLADDAATDVFNVNTVQVDSPALAAFLYGGGSSADSAAACSAVEQSSAHASIVATAQSFSNAPVARATGPNAGRAGFNVETDEEPVPEPAPVVTAPAEPDGPNEDPMEEDYQGEDSPVPPLQITRIIVPADFGQSM